MDLPCAFWDCPRSLHFTLLATLISFSVLAFLPLLQLLQCLSGYMCGHNLTMKFPPDFHNYTGLKGLVNSFS